MYKLNECAAELLETSPNAVMSGVSLIFALFFVFFSQFVLSVFCCFSFGSPLLFVQPRLAPVLVYCFCLSSGQLGPPRFVYFLFKQVCPLTKPPRKTLLIIMCPHISTQRHTWSLYSSFNLLMVTRKDRDSDHWCGSEQGSWV